MISCTTISMSSPTKHSILSASSCERWWNCPGSVRMCKDIPNPPNKYTAEGTVAHSLAELSLEHPNMSLEPHIGKMKIQDGFEIEITEQMVDAVYEYRNYVLGVQKEEGGWPLRLETRIELKEVNAVLFGTVDCVMVVPFKTVHVFDLKFGQGKRVSAWQNKQLMEYALGVGLQEDCDEYVLHICQPRVEDGFTSFRVSAEDMDQFQADLEKRSEEALNPKAKMVPGDWCKGSFCPARFKCPALNGLAQDLVAKDFAAPAVVDKLTMEHIVKVLKYEDTIKDWMARVRDHAKELMLQGEDVPGYKVVQSLGNAKWVDESVIKAEFEDEFGDKMYSKKLLSPAQFEKVAGKKRLGPSFRADYTIRMETGFKIVGNDKKGEPVKLAKPEEDFK